MRCICFIHVATLILAATHHVAAQAAASSSIVLRAARMLDVKTGAVIKSATVVVKGERIVAAGANVAAPADATVIDLGDVTVREAATMLDCAGVIGASA